MPFSLPTLKAIKSARKRSARLCRWYGRIKLYLLALYVVHYSENSTYQSVAASHIRSINISEYESGLIYVAAGDIYTPY